MNADVRAVVDAADAHGQDSDEPVLVRVRVGFPEEEATEPVDALAAVVSAKEWDQDGERHVYLVLDEAHRGASPPFPFDRAVGIDTFNLSAHTDADGEWCGPLGSYMTDADPEGPNQGEHETAALLDVRSVEHDPDPTETDGEEGVIDE